MTKTTCLSKLAEAAGRYARHGWHVFPLHHPVGGGCSCGVADCGNVGKHPRIQGGFHKATNDLEQIEAWWNTWPEAGIGLATGASGLVVVDVDGPDGEAAAEKLGLFSEPTWSVTTGRAEGGRHLYFRHPGNGAVIGNRALAPHVDVRADGGYVVAPPSVHVSGKQYQWGARHTDAPLPLPPRVVEILVRSAQEKGSGSAAVIPERIPTGQRNETLASFAGTLRRRGLSKEAILAQLEAMNVSQCDPPLEERELERIAASVATYPAGGDAEEAELVNARCTDVGNARRFIAQHGTKVRYCHTWRKWLEWDGTRWAIDETSAITRRAKATLDALFHAAAGLEDDERRRLIKHAMASERGARLDAMLRLAESDERAAITAAVLDTDPWKLNVLNGTLDLRTGELLPHDPKQMHTKLAAVSYGEMAECPRFLAFLEEILPDPEVRDFVQRAVGYSLTGDTRERCLFIPYGTGGNGKSTFLEAIRGLLGDYACQADVSTFMLGRTDSGPRPEVVRLAGVRFVSSIEVEENRRLAESLVKALTGNDTIAARGLYSDIVEFRPAFKLWLGTNHKPTIRGTDNAIWDRIRLIPFTVTISPERRDGDLATKLADELPGILAWALEGCLAWQQEGLAAPDAVRVATDSYREEMDTVRRFLSDRCVESPTETIGASDLYAAYKRWAEDGSEKPMTQTRFGTRMGELGYQSKDRDAATRRKTYVGVALEGTP